MQYSCLSWVVEISPASFESCFCNNLSDLKKLSLLCLFSSLAVWVCRTVSTMFSAPPIYSQLGGQQPSKISRELVKKEIESSVPTHLLQPTIFLSMKSKLFLLRTSCISRNFFLMLRHVKPLCFLFSSFLLMLKAKHRQHFYTPIYYHSWVTLSDETFPQSNLLLSDNWNCLLTYCPCIYVAFSGSHSLSNNKDTWSAYSYTAYCCEIFLLPL